MIALGCDQAGFELKLAVIKYLEDNSIPFLDLGSYSTDSVDYPVYAKKVVKSILLGESDKGILICGTGIGISIAANRYKGIRAALCHDVFSAKATRLHNDANILAMGGRVIGQGHAIEIVKAFLETDYSGEERHTRRINMFDDENM